MGISIIYNRPTMPPPSQKISDNLLATANTKHSLHRHILVSRSIVSRSMSTVPSLADICDDHVDSPQRLSVVTPGLFFDYGKKKRFHGRIETVRCFESNPMVRTVLSTPGKFCLHAERLDLLVLRVFLEVIIFPFLIRRD